MTHPAISSTENPDTTHQTAHTEMYDTDFVEWIEQAIALLKQGKFGELDIEHLIEEVGDLGRRDRHSVCSNLEIVLLHLLKWQFKPEQRSNSWRGSIREHRRRIARIIQDSPSLNNYLKQEYAECYAGARRQAADETGLPLGTFPVECPYTIEQGLNEDFLP